MKATSTVSVVIPHYNGTGFIKRAIVSALSQTSPPLEVIVVDDGSGVDHLTNLEALREELDFYIVRQENAGQSAARNRGISEARGEFIALLDQDDYFLPNHIKVLLEPFGSELNHAMLAFAYGDLWRGNEEGVVMTHTCVHDNGRHPKKRIIDLIGSDVMILPSATLIRKSAITAIGGFDPQFRGYEDDDLFLRFFAAGYDSCFIDTAVTFWTINSASTSYSEAMTRSRFKYYQKLITTFPQSTLPNINVFDHLLVPRFGAQFIADVIAAAVGRTLFFDERQERLKVFRKDYLRFNQTDRHKMRRILISTIPLIALNARVLRLVVMIASKFPRVLDNLVHPGTSSFIRGQLNQAKVSKNSSSQKPSMLVK